MNTSCQSNVFLEWQNNRTCVQGDIIYFDFSKDSGTCLEDATIHQMKSQLESYIQKAIHCQNGKCINGHS